MSTSHDPFAPLPSAPGAHATAPEAASEHATIWSQQPAPAPRRSAEWGQAPAPRPQAPVAPSWNGPQAHAQPYAAMAGAPGQPAYGYGAPAHAGTHGGHAGGYGGYVQPAAQAWAQPTPVAGGPLEIAPMRMRLVAYIVDYLVLMMVLGPFSFVIGFVWGAAGYEPETGSGQDSLSIGINLFAATALVAYYALLTGSKGGGNGQTLGKRLAGIRVVRADGVRLTAAGAWGRALAFAAPMIMAAIVGPLVDVALGTGFLVTGVLIGLCLLVFYPGVTIIPGIGQRRATLHDRIARTLVVKAGPYDAVPTASPAHIRELPTTGLNVALSVLGGLMTILCVGLVVALLVLI